MNGSPVPSTTKQELDVTKDNLRLFVERWREHPDSPYSIEAEDLSEVLPEKQYNNIESMSLRCQSPSPCGSICSSISDSTTSTRDTGSRFLLTVPNLGLALERRASEGTNVEKPRDAVAQIVLAEEIIKLSEHLRSIAMGQGVNKSETPPATKSESSSGTSKKRSEKKNIGTNNEKKKLETTRSKVTEKKMKEGKINKKEETIQVSEKDSNEIFEKLSNITRQRKMNGTTFNGNRFEKLTESSGSSNIFTLKKSSKYNTVVFNDSFSTRITDNFSINSDSGAKSSLFDDLDREMDLTPSWRKSRSKRRFSESCRDVPRITSLQDLHKTLNLDDTKSTKDLLLHLLNEWDDARPSAIVRKSSVDWCGEESIARKSMNSLAEFFQSEQKKSTTTTTSKATPSIHR